MKWRGFSLALGVMLLSGCPLATPINETDKPLFDNGVNVFEIQLVDGLTGNLIVGGTVTVHIGSHMLDGTDEDGDGFYTIYGIPRGTFRVSATAANYTDFRAMRTFNGTGSLSRGDNLTYYFNNLIMYPAGTAPGDLVVSVYDGNTGAPVPNAKVLASLDQVTPFINISDPLAPNVGILPPTIAATTGDDGKATFATADLILNARYDVDVFGALDANGVYMVPINNQSVTIGQTVQEMVVFLDRPALNPVALMANNEMTGLLTSLIVTFPYPIELCSEDMDHDWYNSTGNHTTTDSDGDGTVTSPNQTTPVNAVLGAGDTELTLEFNTENDDAGDALYVTFTGVVVKPMGASDNSCTGLTSVRLRNNGGGPTIDTEIHVRPTP